MNVAVVGVGLIGGSVGLAARERLGATVRGHDPGAGGRPVDAGAADAMTATLGEAVADADAAFVCVPVGALEATVRAVLAAAPASCVVTDVGSVKRPWWRRSATSASWAATRWPGPRPPASSTPAATSSRRPPGTSPRPPRRSGILLERLHRLLAGLGARPVALDAVDHDRVMAAVSHLPHVVANVLAAQAVARPGAGPGRRGPPAPDRAELPRRHARRRGAPGALARDLRRQRRRARRRARRRGGAPAGGARARRRGRPGGARGLAGAGRRGPPPPARRRPARRRPGRAAPRGPQPPRGGGGARARRSAAPA